MTDCGNENNIDAAVEAVLFACGYPISTEDLCFSLELDQKALLCSLERLKRRYESEVRGFRLIRLNSSYQLCSAERYASAIRKALNISKNDGIARPALEILSIIASFQPTTKRFIDDIRGVDSSYWLDWLTEHELIEPAGRLDRRGQPKAYATTMNFLRMFHLSSISELPDIGTVEGRDTEPPPQELDLSELEGLI